MKEDLLELSVEKLNINGSLKYSDDRTAIFHFKNGIYYYYHHKKQYYRVRVNTVVVNKIVEEKQSKYDDNETFVNEYLDVKIVTVEKVYNFKVYPNSRIINDSRYGTMGRYVDSFLDLSSVKDK